MSVSNLTKEECLRVLIILATKSTNAEDLMKIYPYFKYELDMMINLIDEHFDNPPLKFEELKEGMWVWDSKNDAWVCIDRAIANVSYCKRLEDSGLVILFEENRYYRKEVK